MNNLNTLIDENSKLIYSLVKKYGNNSNKEDLYQVGILGLINAYNNYDPSYNVKFSTYAYTYIQGEIKKYITSDKLIKVGREYNKIAQSINRAQTLLEQKYMRKPTDHELSLFLEIDEKIINEVKTSLYYVESLDQPVNNNDDKMNLYDSVSNSEKMLNIDYLFLKEEISLLPKEEQKLIKYRYYMDKTQQEVAELLGINQVQVSRHEQKILRKIKSNYQM